MAGARFSSGGDLDGSHEDDSKARSGTRISQHPQVLTVKTPLLPRKSGITMESARHYGADVEKRAPGLSSDEYDADLLSRNALEQQHRSGRQGVRWLAVLAVVGLTTVTMFHGGRVYSAAEKAIGRAKHTSGAQLSPSFEDIAARQSESNSSQHYGTLEPMALNPLPLGSIQGLGWLGAEMDNLANGLAGHEMDFFPIVSQNPWIGGQIDYSELLEGYPYWLNGLVPLAYQTNNDRLKQQVLGSVKYVLAQQDPTDGMIGPVRFGNSLDIWSRFPLLLGLKNLADADSSMTTPIVSAMHKFLPHAYALLGDGQLVATNEAWARSRYADFLLTLQWLFEKHPSVNGTDNRGLIWQTMVRMRDVGIDWAGYYTQQSYYFQDIDNVPISTSDGSFHFPFLHGVNVGQGLKTMAVDWRFTHNDSLLPVQRDAVEWTLKYHGAPSGTVIGDERESGLAPNRGSELCTAVETMFSMHTIYAITGENAYADHAEMAAFNALPVMLTNNAWAHQYIAPPNLPYAAPVQGNAVFWNVGDFGTTYGTSPNYPCCAVNHPQGYPKFTQATFMSVGNDGLAHVLLAPAQATTKLGNGANVKVAANTDYPFSDILTYSITSDKPFTFYVRVPTWASSPAMTVNGKQGVVTAGANGLSPVSVGSGTTTVQFVLKSALRTVERANDTIAVYRGALLYALDVGQVNTSTPGSADITRNQPPGGNADVQAALSYYHNVSIEPTNLPAGARDYNMSNTKAWNFALDETTLRFFSYNGSSKTGDAVNHTSTVMQQGESASGDASGKTPSLAIPIFGYQAPSMYVTAQACQVDWSLLGGIPFRPPLKGDRKCLGKSVEIVMRPYGSLNLHMSQLPTVDLSSNKTSSS